MGCRMKAARDTILCGDALDTLRTLPDECVQMVVTSPPYWGLRDYGVAGQLGLEPTPEEWVESMVAIFAEVRRVLRRDGTLWLNVGDCYANDTKWGGTSGGVMAKGLHGKQDVGYRRRRHTGLKPKDLVGLPWMLAFALRADGWWLRSDIVWHKPNPMPESVTDRPTKSHEYLFLLSKSAQYYYDADAIREPVTGGAHPRARAGRNSREHVDRDPRHLAAVPSGWDTRVGSGGHGSIHRQGRRPRGVTPKSAPAGSRIKANESFHAATTQLVTTRNKRSVWTVATAPYADAHFATFPPRLIEPCILAGSRPGDLVLDPFMGAGTTAVVARRHSRHYLGIELNPSYIELAEERIAAEIQPVLWTCDAQGGVA